MLRTDGGARIGIGPVMGCLALAQAIKDAGGNAVFVMTLGAPAHEVRLKEEGMEVIRLKVLPGLGQCDTAHHVISPNIGPAIGVQH